MYGCAVYLIIGLVILSFLVPFTVFHAGSLFGNYTTKSVWNPTAIAEKLRFNTRGEMRELCCLPIRFRCKTCALETDSIGEESLSGDEAEVDQLGMLS
eukprot:UN2191